MERRRFLLLSGAAALAAGCSRLGLAELPANVYQPGMHEGHLLRDHASLPPPSGELHTKMLIVGSGVAGLTAGWKLAREGFDDFLLLAGPELYGNAAGGSFGNHLHYPRGAHYLPLPSRESSHVREMLAEFGVIQADPYGARPEYDEAVLVHAPDERVFYRGEWQEGLIPTKGVAAAEQAELKRFFAYTDALKQRRGADGRRVFAIPIELSSQDPQWTQLDRLTLQSWLQQQDYRSAVLHRYLDYCCRDDFGAGYAAVSAWAGLHYFAARAGQARNAAEGAVLTWPDGLNPLARQLLARIKQPPAKSGLPQTRVQPGFAIHLRETPNGVEALCGQITAQGLKTFTINAKRAICAMPTHVAAHVVERIEQYGFDPAIHTPPHAAWVVSNFLLNGFPAEEAGVPLAWDNVVHGGAGLGYVVSTHQDITWAPPAQTVFSAYQVLSNSSPQAARRWLQQASRDELYQQAVCDLNSVYGSRLRQHATELEITVRGHAMASPLSGFLSNRGLHALRNVDGKLLFAHADLSGFSVFEEASWWGYRAALRVLGG
jgi:hypothetical protein